MAKNALIVDDSKSACRVLEGLLKSHNVVAHSVHSAEDALKYLRTAKPDVIFLDHNMPGMDGLQAVKIIKSNPSTAAIPVLMYTTKEGEVYLGQARALGAVDVLTKERIRDHLKDSLAKLGMLDGTNRRDPGALVTGDELPPRVTAASSNLEEWLQQMQSELSRQMYLILTEEQIAQQEQTKRIAGLVQKLVTSNNDEIIRRMEVLQELYRAEKQMEARKRRWVTFGVVVAGLAVAAVLFWQGQRSDAALNQLRVELRSFAADADAGAQTRTEPEPQSIPTVAAAPPPEVEPTPRPLPPGPEEKGEAFALHDRNGARIGRLLGVDVQAARYQAATQTGYLFTVNVQGQAGTAIQTRYYAAANCVGEPMVEALSGAIYRDGGDQLWFTPREGEVFEVRPLSMMDLGEACQPIDSEARQLRALLPNDPEVTQLSVDDEPIRLVTVEDTGSNDR